MKLNSTLYALLITTSLMTSNIAAQSPCDSSESLIAGETTSAEIITLEVPEASLVHLGWGEGARVESVPCASNAATVLEDGEDGLMLAFSRAGSHTFRLLPTGLAQSVVAPRVRADRLDAVARQDSFTVEIGEQWVEIIQTTFEGAEAAPLKDQVVTDPDPEAPSPITQSPPNRAIATHFELRDLVRHGTGPWLASLVISSRTTASVRELAKSLGHGASASLSAYVERGHRFGKDQVVTDPDPNKDQVVTDPDPEKDQVVTDPDPNKDQVVTDPDPLLSSPTFAWRVDLVMEGGNAAARHLDALAWLAPLVWPELYFESDAKAPAGQLLAWQAAL